MIKIFNKNLLFSLNTGREDIIYSLDEIKEKFNVSEIEGSDLLTYVNKPEVLGFVKSDIFKDSYHSFMQVYEYQQKNGEFYYIKKEKQ